MHSMHDVIESILVFDINCSELQVRHGLWARMTRYNMYVYTGTRERAGVCVCSLLVLSGESAEDSRLSVARGINEVQSLTQRWSLGRSVRRYA